ncbi:MAG: hypothetical protein AAFP03_04190 [Cyanobacteria bacterium J06598_3]
MPSPQKKRITRWLWGGALALLLVGIGDYLHYSSTRTQKQCAQWIPHLEAYRKAKGQYPNNFSKLADHNPAAEALNYREYGCGYGTTRGESFELQTPEIGVKARVYHSETGEWQKASDGNIAN